MYSALVYLPYTDSYMVLNRVKCRSSGYKLIKKQTGEFAIFVGWL